MQEGSPIVGGITLALLAGSLLAWGAIGERLVRRRRLVEFEPRFVVPWAAWDVMALALSYLFCEVLAVSIARHLTGGSPAAISPTALAAQTTARLVWLVGAVAYLQFKSGAYADDLGITLRRGGYDLRLGGVMFLAVILPVFAVQWLLVFVLEMPSDHPLLKLTREGNNLGVMVLATVAAVVVAPLFEEFVFRVVLQGWLETQQVTLQERREGQSGGRPGFAPLVIASLLFAALHAGSWPDPLPIFVLSLFLGYAYRQTHRMLPSLVIHACVNGWTMLNVWILYLSGSST